MHSRAAKTIGVASTMGDCAVCTVFRKKTLRSSNQFDLNLNENFRQIANKILIQTA